MIFFKVLVQI